MDKLGKRRGYEYRDDNRIETTVDWRQADAREGSKRGRARREARESSTEACADAEGELAGDDGSRGREGSEKAEEARPV